MSLLDIFLTLDTPQTENPKLFNAVQLDDFPFAKVGINHIGYPVILISSKVDRTNSIRKNIILKYIELAHELECKISENGRIEYANYTTVVFKSNSDLLLKYFFSILSSLLTSLEGKPTQIQISDSFKGFVEILRCLSDNPTKTSQGLWAELLLIEQSKNPEVLINYWHNMPGEKFDFNADTQKVEVKSSAQLERIHIFTSEQVNPENQAQVIVASVFTKQTSTGLDIMDLIKRIEKRVFDVLLIAKLYRIVGKTLGSALEQATRVKYDYELGKKSLRFYAHQDISKVERISIPDRVSEVKFKSDLTFIDPIDAHLIRSNKLGKLFEAIL